MKILLADDDVITASLIESLLRKEGYDVISVTNGNEAWDIMSKSDAPRIAILDWIMPGIDGLEVCKKIRMKLMSKVFIILLTGRSDKSDVTAGLDAGADDYITKPFDYNELRARVAVGKRFVELQESLERNINQLSEALSHIKTLQGLLPICMYCHKIRKDDKVWEQLEIYITEHSDAHFSHGICPDCLKKFHSDDKMK